MFVNVFCGFSSCRLVQEFAIKMDNKYDHNASYKLLTCIQLLLLKSVRILFGSHPKSVDWVEHSTKMVGWFWLWKPLYCHSNFWWLESFGRWFESSWNNNKWLTVLTWVPLSKLNFRTLGGESSTLKFGLLAKWWLRLKNCFNYQWHIKISLPNELKLIGDR